MKKVVKSKSLIILVGIAVALFVGSSFLFLQEAKTDNPQTPSTAAIRSGTSSATVNKPGAPPAPPEKPALSKVATALGIPSKLIIPEDSKKNIRHHSGVPAPSVSKSALLTQGFEEGIMPPTGWSVVVNNPYTWHIESYDPYEGYYHAVCFYDQDYTGTQDEWMISPVIDLTTKGESWQLTFYWYSSYYWGVDPYDNYELEVWIDTDGDGSWDAKLWCEDDVGVFTSWQWYRADVSLAAYLAYNNVKLGFRYYGYDGAEGSFDGILVDVAGVGRCCYGDPYNPSCADVTQSDCDALSGTWDYGLNCTDNPCPIPGEGEDCSSAIAIASLPYNTTGNSCGYVNDYDAVCPYSGGTAPDVVYSYSPASDEAINIDLCNSSYDTKVFVYEDVCSTDPYVFYGCNDDLCGDDGYKSAIYGISVYAGHTYYIVVDGYGTSCGDYDLRITQASEAPPNDECTGAPIINTFPQTVYGTTIGATIDCPGVLDWNAVWYQFDLPYTCNNLYVDYCPTTDSIWTFGVVLYGECPPDCPNYILRTGYQWTYLCPNGYMAPQAWWDNLPGPASYWFPVYVADENGNPFLDFGFEVSVTECPPPPANDNCASAEPIGDVINLPFSTAQATFDGPGGCQTAPNIWYCYTADCDGMAHIALCGSAYDTKLAVYDGCECDPVGTTLGCNDDACGGTLQSELQIPVYNGQQLLIEVGGYSSSTGSGVLTCSCYVPPEGPPNDNCEDAEVLQDPLPVCPDYQTVYGTTIGATNDCPGVFDWPGVWYTFNLPYASNNLNVDYCPTNDPEVGTRSIALLNSCNNCAGWIAASSYTWVTCPSGYTDLQLSWRGLPPGQYWLPVLAWDYNSNNMDFAFNICVEEAMPCSLVCPPGGIPEGEPDCYDAYVDTYNGGCNSSPYVFQSINCGDTICGTSGVYADAYYRDTDWFRVEVAEGNLTWTCVAEFPVLLFIMDAGSENCVDYTTLTYNYTYDVCDTLSISYYVTAGVYWLWVGPVDWGNYPCGDQSEYIAWADCVPFGAQIAVDPASMYPVLNPSGDCSTAEEDLVISNEGGEDLNYSIAETPPVDWMELSSYSGTIPAGNQHTLVTSFDATGMTPGDYYTDLVITSNDPDDPQVTVPVHLTVEMAPEIDVPSRIWQPVPPGCTSTYDLRIYNLGEGELRFGLSVEKNPPPPAAPKSGNPWETLSGAGDARLIDKSTLPLPTISAPAEVSRSSSIPGVGAGKGILTQGIIWDNGMTYDYGLGASQWDESFDFEPIIADDYILDEDMQVTRVDWIGGYWNPVEDGDFDWEVVLYEDDGDIKPGTPMATFSFANADVHETLIEESFGYICSYYVDLPTPVPCDAGIKYWVSVQGIGYYPPQSGWGVHTSILLHQAVFKSVYFGYPDWTNTETIFGVAVDGAFQLTGEPAGPPCPFTVYPEEGTVPAESFTEVFLTYDGSLFEQCVDDTLMCYLWITSNDCDEPLLVVDVLATSARGDVQRDYCVINSADLVFLINYVFKGGPAPDPYCLGDVDRDGDVDSDDVLYLLSYLFLYGPPPEIPTAPKTDQTIRPMR